MGELSIEEKAKAYDEAIKRAKAMIKVADNQDEYIGFTNTIFPELKESEDDRIRKTLIEYFNAYPKDYYGELKKSHILAWLEKQGKCKTDCHRNHQDANHPKGCIVLEDFNGGEGFYKVHLDYLNEKQVKEVEEMVRTWNKDSKVSNENIKSCVGMCLTDVCEQRFKDYNTSLKDCLAWLERQGDTNETINKDEKQRILRGIAINLIAWIDYNAAGGNMCLSIMECKDIENALVSGDWDKIYAYIKKKLEKQGEKEFTFKSIPRLLEMVEPTDRAKSYCQKLIDSLVKERYGTDAKIVEGVLKGWNGEYVPMAIMDEQNPADKVEPTFKVGDKVMMKDFESFPHICTIESIDEATYYGDTTNFDIKDQNNWKYAEHESTEVNHYHLWTIKDAKDGDVLAVNKDDVILIFRGIGNEEWNDVIDYYCRYDCYQKEFIVQKDLEFWGYINDNQLKPATKEQCDTLMKAMANAGWEFDFEKKKLKKIPNALEECEIEHIEHGKYYYCIKDYYSGGNKRVSKGEVIQALRGMSMMALGVKANEYFIPVKCIIGDRCDWSEEDEKNLIEVISIVQNISSYDKQYDGYVNWLKSIRQRIGE